MSYKTHGKIWTSPVSYIDWGFAQFWAPTSVSYKQFLTTHTASTQQTYSEDFQWIPYCVSAPSRWSILKAMFHIFNFLSFDRHFWMCFFDSRSMRKVRNSNPMLKRMIVRCFFDKKRFFLDSFYYVKFHFKILIIE